MFSRREFVRTALTSIGAMAALPACSSQNSVDGYEEVAKRTWRHGQAATGDKAARLGVAPVMNEQPRHPSRQRRRRTSRARGAHRRHDAGTGTNGHDGASRVRPGEVIA
jgi:hypothetical protein